MSEFLSVTYVGDFSSIHARFGSVRYYFEWGQTRLIPNEHAHHFLKNSSMLFIMRDPNEDRSDRDWVNVLVRRSGCLGDVLAAHAGLSALKARYGRRLKITYQVAVQYGSLFEGHSTYERVVCWNQRLFERKGILPIDVLVNLDGVFEYDHVLNGPRDSRVSRTMSMFKSSLAPFMDMDITGLVPDFSLRIPEAERREAFRRLHGKGLDKGTRVEPMIAISMLSNANRHQRTPDREATRKVMDYFIGEGFWVYMIDGSPSHHPKVLTVDGCSVQTTLAMMEHCDVVVTPDSGAMWLAHVVPLPMVCWLGPTPAYAKCNYHPLSHLGGVIPIQANDWINCPSCFEQAVVCNSSFECIKDRLDHRRFVSETVEATLNLVEKSRNGGFKGGTPRWVDPRNGYADQGVGHRGQDAGEDREAVRGPGLQAEPVRLDRDLSGGQCDARVGGDDPGRTGAA